ncbi:MAG TPA: hypothetical protein VI306_00740 [Pyrinomonadaceae bacterium]
MLHKLIKLKAWWANQNGLETAEWALLLGAVIVPVAYFILEIAKYVASFYQITSWVTTLPFP